QDAHPHEIEIDGVVRMAPVLSRAVTPAVDHSLNVLVKFHADLYAFIGQVGAEAAPIAAEVAARPEVGRIIGNRQEPGGRLGRRSGGVFFRTVAWLVVRINGAREWGERQNAKKGRNRVSTDLINTPLQRGVRACLGERNCFNSFEVRTKTVKTV